MENFEQRFEPRNEGVKEKNLYIVHLDMPRIIILSSVIVGIVAASFLFGMNFFNKGNSPDRNLTVNEREIADNDEDLFGNLKDEEELASHKSDDLSMDEEGEILGLEKKRESSDISENSQDAMDSAKTSAKAEDKTDVLTKENIKEIISPAQKSKDVVVKKEKKHKKSVKVAKTVKSHRTSKAIAVKGNAKKVNRKSRSRVVQASKVAVSRHTSGGGFAVQVASYDRLPRARSEVNRLKSRNFDAYVDRTIVRGKTFYRVKIGPVQSKNMATSLLNGVKADSRYSGSYITRD